MAALLLVLATLGVSPDGAAAPGGDDVFVCDFENHPHQAGQANHDADPDYDGWPDGWTRSRSLKLPEFVRMSIVAEGQTISSAAAQPSPAKVNRVLRMELDGGGAEIGSPLTPVSPHFSLMLTLRIRAAGLAHDRAWATLSLQDADGKVLQSAQSRPLGATADWQRVEIGPITPESDQVARAVISLHLGPLGDEQDLAGSAEFDELRLVRLPRMTLETNSTTGLYVDTASPEFTCDVSGIRIAEPQIRFDLFDHQGQVLATHTSPLKAVASRAQIVGERDTPASGYAGRTTWKPPVPGYGYFRVTASLVTADNAVSVLTRVKTLAVLRPLPPPRHSEFGWSLPSGEQPYGYGPLASLLGQAGVGWAKLPVWYDGRDTSRGERIAWFAEQLSIQGIELVGVLDQPPDELRQVFREPGRLAVASVFAEPDLWDPAVSTVMTRLSLRVRWWQLGDDLDTSFVGYPQAEAKIAEIKRRLQQYGQEVRLGVGWRWLHPPLDVGEGSPPWTFLSYSAEPDLTASELSYYLARPARTQDADAAAALEAKTVSSRGSSRTVATPPKAAAPPQRWVMLTPLSSEDYLMEGRVQDLVQRMLACRMHGANAVFVPLPFDAHQGLMNADASPGELFVPWRTTAALIGGAEYLGPIQLPGGSTCQAFGRDGQAVLALWNERPATERLYFGDGVEQIDVWGRNVLSSQSAVEGQSEREVAVGPLPTFLTGQSAAVARWQASLAFESPRVASYSRVEQPIGLRVPNSFDQGIGGELKLIAPTSWAIDSRPVRFKVAAGEELRLEVPVDLPDDANSGPQPVRLDFEITADRSYKFSVYRTLQLGLDDVQIELSTKLREDGALIVEQQLTNLSDKAVSFRCLLFPPGRRRETRQVIDAEPGNTATTYILPRGSALLGQRLWLRAEEIGGARVLNHTVTAEP